MAKPRTMIRKRAALDIEIDKNNLDQEWLNQPRLYFRYAADVADAEEEMRRAKADLDLVAAELDQKIRSNPEKHGVDKATEAAVKAAIPRQQQYKDALDVYYEAKHEHDILQAAVAALDQRKRALEKLVDLFLSNYYSRPVAKGSSGEAMEEMEKRVSRRPKHRREG